MKPTLTLLTALLLAPLAALHATDAPPKPASGKPNIIVILTDDLGWADLGVQGFDEYFTGTMQDYTASHALDGTPNIDRLATNGMRVTARPPFAQSGGNPCPTGEIFIHKGSSRMRWTPIRRCA
jgi:hypothetical protein